MSTYEDDDSRWAAVTSRDPAADRAFVYGVRTTKIYCRPICKARLARRSNVTFYRTPQEAQDAGFRACKRCKPELPSGMPEEDAVRKIREFVAQAPTDVELSTLNQMAKYTGLSKWHFHRVFKKVVGMTPNEYTTARRLGSPQASTSQQSPDTLPDLGMSTSASVTTPSSSGVRTSESTWDALDWLGQHDPEWFNFDPMNTPGEQYNLDAMLKKTVIQYTVRSTSFGPLIIAFEDGKVCMVNQPGPNVDPAAFIEEKFPSLLYEHKLINGNGTDPTDPIHNHIAAIMDTLEKNP